MGSRKNSINFCDIFDAPSLASELGARWAECEADAEDMCIHAKRHMFNLCLQHLKIAEAFIAPRAPKVNDSSRNNQLLKALRIFRDVERLLRFEGRAEVDREKC
ncbi:Oidioi.mRNA.OKI2018_I69.chr1.g368.t1.cds [Oikopleura dioica]|uniref:Oidioi.mRNA.OKI2018_I69.chr1.g368.t1.cds n=1 Tax=Oikopleura dioica TaxID=34765 RepID=A0ABN7SJL1_OIKDI|nr:Oidioi.mRNA.OKI2018_I69.chr1.g368.t1.cds [Oikopleura dioica]